MPRDRNARAHSTVESVGAQWALPPDRLDRWTATLEHFAEAELLLALSLACDVDPSLYAAAQRVCQLQSLPWVDPRTGRAYEPATAGVALGAGLAEPIQAGQSSFQLGEFRARPFIRCRLCGHMSELADDIENRYCGSCGVFHDLVAEARRNFAQGTPHECGAWQTARRACAVCGYVARSLGREDEK